MCLNSFFRIIYLFLFFRYYTGWTGVVHGVDPSGSYDDAVITQKEGQGLGRVASISLPRPVLSTVLSWLSEYQLLDFTHPQYESTLETVRQEMRVLENKLRSDIGNDETTVEKIWCDIGDHCLTGNTHSLTHTNTHSHSLSLSLTLTHTHSHTHTHTLSHTNTLTHTLTHSHSLYILSVTVGDTRSYLVALEWYRKSAEAGYDKAQLKMGHMIKRGKGAAQNYEVAAKWYEKSGAQGNMTAQVTQMKMILNDQCVGVANGDAPTDPPSVLMECAAKDNVKAQYTLGKCLFDANEDEVAHVYFAKAAAQGHKKAQYYLGKQYMNGWGVEKNGQIGKIYLHLLFFAGCCCCFGHVPNFKVTHP